MSVNLTAFHIQAEEGTEVPEEQPATEEISEETLPEPEEQPLIEEVPSAEEEQPSLEEEEPEETVSEEEPVPSEEPEENNEELQEEPVSETEPGSEEVLEETGEAGEEDALEEGEGSADKKDAEEEEEVFEEVDLSESVIQFGRWSRRREAFSALAAESDPISNYSEVEAYVVSHLETWDAEINVSSFNIPYSSGQKVVAEIINRNPQLFYLSNMVAMGTKGGMVTKIKPNYDSDYSKADVAEFENTIDQMISGVDFGWNDMMRALYVHDALVIRNEYDMSYEGYTAYDAIVRRSSVCEGYALAYRYLCKRVGLECDMICSDVLDGGGHAWNLVFIDGVGYYVDCTWDDPINSTAMMCLHTNFLCSQSALINTGHKSNDWYDYCTYETVYGQYTNTKYDNVAFRTSNAPTIIQGTSISYMLSGDAHLKVYDSARGTASSLGSAFSDASWPLFGGRGNWSGKYWGLASYNGNYYVSGPSTVYSVSSSGTVSEVYKLSDEEKKIGYIYGIRVDENGILSYDLYQHKANSSPVYKQSRTKNLNGGADLTGIRFPNSLLTVHAGETTQLSVDPQPANAFWDSLTWSSDNPSVLRVDANGVLSDCGVAGTAVITATAKANGKTFTATCKISVRVNAVTSIKAVLASSEIPAGSSARITTTFSPSNATNQNLLYETSDAGIATVSADGVVTGVSAGTATITVKSAEKPTITSKVTVKVTAAAIQLTGIKFPSSELSLGERDTIQLSVEPQPANAVWEKLNWSSGNPSVLKVDSNGMISGCGVAGTAVVTATAIANGKTFTATCKVTVRTVAVTSIQSGLADSEIHVGSSSRITTTFTPADATNRNLLYETSNAGIATVSSDGTVTGVGIGTATITVKSAEKPTITSKVSVKVTAAVIPLTGIKFPNVLMTLDADETEQLRVEPQPANASWDKLTWSSENPSILKVDANGVISGCGTAGTSVVTATATSGGKTFTATCKVSVRVVAVKSIQSVIADSEILAGASTQITTTFNPTNATNQKLIYETSDARVATVDQAGIVTGVDGGTATITVKSAEKNTITSKVVVKVLASVKKITINKPAMDLTTGSITPLSVSFEPADAENKELTWSSSDTSIATVSQNGEVKGIKAGTVVITAVSKANPAVKASLSITIKTPTLSGISFEVSRANVAARKTLQLKVLPTPASMSLPDHMEYSSSNEKAATVNENGLVTGVGSGMTVITVKAGGFSASCEVVVYDNQIVVEVPESEDGFTYNGAAQKPAVVVIDGGRTLSKSDYTASYKNNTNAGTGVITIKMKGSYQGNYERPFTIAKADVSDGGMRIDNTELAYTGKVLKPKLAFYWCGKKLKEGTDYRLTAGFSQPVQEVGVYDYTMTGIGTNFKGSRTVSLYVKPKAEVTKPIAITSCHMTVSSLTYDGNLKTLDKNTLKFTNKTTGKVLEEGKDYVIVESSYTNNLNVGTASVTVTGIGDYGSSKKVSFKIEPSRKSIPASQVTVNYGNDVPYAKGGATPVVTVAGLSEGTDFKVKYANNKAVGTGSVTVTFLNNYKAVPAVSKSFRIVQQDLGRVDGYAKDLTLANTSAIIKAGKFISKPVLVDLDGKTLKAGTDYSNTIRYYEYFPATGTTSSVELGSSTIAKYNMYIKAVVTGTGSYKGTKEIIYHVVLKTGDVSKAKTSAIASQEYTGYPIELDFSRITVTVSNRKLTLDKDYRVLYYMNNTKKGTAKVVIQGIGDYGGIKTISFKIVGKSILSYILK